jgi:acetyl esterase/lipase
MIMRIAGSLIAPILFIIPAAIADVRLQGGSTLVTLWADHPAAPQPLVEPGAGEIVEERGTVDASGAFTRHDRTISHVTRPSLTLTFPADDKEPARPRPGIIICPGGGYVRLAIDKEGLEIAKWFNDRGFVTAILKYRMPTTMPATAPSDQKPMPIADVVRAVALVRERASQWRIDPNKIGVIGFSAGGHVASSAITQFTDASERPDFAILMYPVVSMKQDLAHPGSRRALVGESPTNEMIERFSNELHVRNQTPPTFIVHARDDKTVKVQNSVELAEGMQRAGVVHELLLLGSGGHGFGLAVGAPAGVWTSKCQEWLKKISIAP